MTAMPREGRVAMWMLRAGLALAAAGIAGFFLSYGQVGAPAVAGADFHAPPPAAVLSIVAWVAGMALAFGARWYAVAVAAGRAARQAEADGASAPTEEG